MIDLKTAKTFLRNDIRNQLSEVSDDQLAKWSQKLTDRLIASKEYQKAKVIMMFLSFGQEYDTSAIIEDAFSKGKIVCVPKVDWNVWRMDPVQMNNPQDYVTDERGLSQPTGDDVFEANQIDLVLVPGVAFYSFGNRLGRGGGFYDRFLARSDLRATLIAPTFELEILPEVPYDCKDKGVVIILTPIRKLTIRP